MKTSTPQDPRDQDSQALWCVYDRHLDPLHLAATLTEAEAWATGHWRATQTADGDAVAPHDHCYLLSAVPRDTGTGARGFLADVIRRDGVDALRRTRMPHRDRAHTHRPAP